MLTIAVTSEFNLLRRLSILHREDKTDIDNKDPLQRWRGSFFYHNQIDEIAFEGKYKTNVLFVKPQQWRRVLEFNRKPNE